MTARIDLSRPSLLGVLVAALALVIGTSSTHGPAPLPSDLAAARLSNPSPPPEGAWMDAAARLSEAAPDAPPLRPDAPASFAPPLSPIELQPFSAAATLYRKGAIAAADAIAQNIVDPVQRAALEWVALKGSPAPDGARLAAFARAEPDWPASDWIHAVREASLYTRHAAAAEIDAEFSGRQPATPPGALAAARAALAEARPGDAEKIVRGLWRDHDLDGGTEGAVLREFGGMLTRADHKYRADRLLYAEKAGSALRAAALAGADEVALAYARLEASRGPLSPRTVGAVPAALLADPGLTFARVQDARRTGRVAEADALIASAPHDAASLIDPDKWWSERRMVARLELDRGEFAKAYALCADAPTASEPARVDADFHAGWIALRFLHDASAAARHFAAAALEADTPLGIARANYWRGRTAEAMDQTESARGFYERAAAYPIAYYGQLAAERLGRSGPQPPRAPGGAALGADRFLATRVIEIYLEAGLDDFAVPLAYGAANQWTDETQIAALGEVIGKHASAPVAVTFGKIATGRGFALDEVAFPTAALPAFAPLPHSADAASVLAVARQESEFIWHAASGAGAKGLMQILPTTAMSTARRAGAPFDYQRLIFDPAYNLQLGAAYLGQLIDDEGGSFELAAAAYNAGQGRVAQWLTQYGDPRTGAVDLVDWVERIPFDETRDYVERVSENLAIYRARLAADALTHAEKTARE